MDITLTDADYQTLEREQALEILTLRRERAVMIRRIGELMRVVGDLSARLEAVPSAPAESPAAPKARKKA